MVSENTEQLHKQVRNFAAQLAESQKELNSYAGKPGAGAMVRQIESGIELRKKNLNRALKHYSQALVNDYLFGR